MPLAPPSSRGLAFESLPQALGYQAWNFDPAFASANVAPVPGTVYLAAVGYAAGQVVTYTDWISTVAGAGTVPTHIYTGVSDSAGLMLAQSADDAANAGWAAAAPHITRSALAAALAIPATGLYYHVILQVGTWSVTQLTLQRSSGPTNNPSGLLTQAAGATTAQTALPANGSAIAGGLTTTGAFRYWSASE